MTRRWQLTLAAWWTALALVAFLAVAHVIRAQLAWPFEQAMRFKIATYEASKAEFDAVYLGSSRIDLGLDPSVLDATVTKHLGRPFVSYNLGITASFSFETDRLVRWIVATRSPRLKAIVLEAPDFSALRGRGDNRFTSRTVTWHDLRQGPLAVASRWVDPRKPGHRFADALYHARCTIRRQANYGLGPDGMLFGWPGRRPAPAGRKLIHSGVRGFVPDSPTHPRFRRAHARFEQRVSKLRAGAKRHTLTWLQQDAVAAQYRFITDAGLEVLYVTPPTIHEMPDFDPLIAAGRIPALHRYDRPDEHPALYAIENRHNNDHLNGAGARIWSEMVATELANLLTSREARAQ